MWPHCAHLGTQIFRNNENFWKILSITFVKAGPRSLLYFSLCLTPILFFDISHRRDQRIRLYKEVGIWLQNGKPLHRSSVY